MSIVESPPQIAKVGDAFALISRNQRGQRIYLAALGESAEDLVHGAEQAEASVNPAPADAEPEFMHVWNADKFLVCLYPTRPAGAPPCMAYELHDGRRLIFVGRDYIPSPRYPCNGDESVAILLAFLAREPNDAEQDYFARYTPTQLAWARIRSATLRRAAAALPLYIGG